MIEQGLKKVKLGDVVGRYQGWLWKFIGKITSPFKGFYRWKKLRKSLEEGYNPEKSYTVKITKLLLKWL